MKISADLKQLWGRLGVFGVMFVLVSGIIGSWVVSTRLLYDFNFYIYGNLGKMVILSAIMLVIITRERLKTLEWLKWTRLGLGYLAAAIALVAVFFILANKLLGYSSFTSNIFLSLITHGVLISIPLLLFLGVCGTEVLRYLIKIFYREIGICAGLAIIFDLIIFQVWKLWPIFSGGVLNSVKFLLSLTFTDVLFTPPLTLSVNNFAVSILQACSGLDSLFMFSALYFFIGLVDYKKLNLVKMVIIYPVTALGLYVVNIFRVYFLIIIGVMISPDLALKLFHTYAGMIFFLIYFFLFWKSTHKWLKK